jgi:hypothetical protein
MAVKTNCRAAAGLTSHCSLLARCCLWACRSAARAARLTPESHASDSNACGVWQRRQERETTIADPPQSRLRPGRFLAGATRRSTRSPWSLADSSPFRALGGRRRSRRCAARFDGLWDAPSVRQRASSVVPLSASRGSSRLQARGLSPGKRGSLASGPSRKRASGLQR